MDLRKLDVTAVLKVIKNMKFSGSHGFDTSCDDIVHLDSERLKLHPQIVEEEIDSGFDSIVVILPWGRSLCDK